MKTFLKTDGEGRREICPHFRDLNLTKMQEDAIAERNQLIQKNPKLRQYQKEIDRLLKNSGAVANRIEVLNILIHGKLLELKHHLMNLALVFKKLESDFESKNEKT